MKRILLLAFFIVFANALFAQFMADNGTGLPYVEKKRDDVNGSPYFMDTWNSGVVLLRDGTRSSVYPLKLNLFTNELLFNLKEETFVVIMPVKEFTMDAIVKQKPVKLLFRCGYKPADDITGETFLEVVADGKKSLVRHLRKEIVETAGYGTSIKNKEFTLVTLLYIASEDGTLVKLKKDKEGLIETLSDKKEAVEAFIKSKKLRCKSEDDIIEVLKFYNSN